MKKKITSRVFIVFIMALTFISCTTDSNEESPVNSTKKADVTLIEAKNFLAVYAKAKDSDKKEIISSFSKKNNINVNESASVIQAVTTTYSPADLAYVFPTDGGFQGTLPTWDMGTLITRDVEWVVVANRLGLWKVKSFERVSHTLQEVKQVLHQFTRFEGLTYGLIAWEDFNSAGDVRVIGMNNQFMSTVRGVIHVTGYYDTPVDNYCIYTIY